MRLRRLVLGLALVGTLALAVFLTTYPGDQAVPYFAWLLRARSVDDLLADPATDRPERDRLETLQEARRVAEGLGLNVGDSFTSVADDGGGPLVWIVTAAPRDRLEAVTWSYPLVGAMAYRGFFDREEADGFAGQQDGMDTWVRGAPAFSTMGLFPEPLPSSILAWPEESLIGLVVHESTHATVFFPGQTAFNETFATFVERQALLDRAEDPAELRRRWERSEKASQRMRDAADTLRALYAEPGGATRRQAVFDDLARDLEEITGRKDRHGWNNARLLGNLAYVGDLGRLEEIHRRLGGNLKETIRFFAALDRSKDPWEQADSTLPRSRAREGGSSPAPPSP